MRKEITKIIYEMLSHIYCDNCRYEDDDNNCDECNRKAMGWEISKGFSEDLACEIELLLTSPNKKLSELEKK